MFAISGSESHDRQVLCIGLPQSTVDRIAGVLGDDVRLTDVADSDRAIAALAIVATRRMSVPEATSRDTAPSANALQLDQLGRRALRGGRELKLSPREFDLLALLLDQPGRAWSYDELSTRVWTQPYLGDPDMIATAIRRLRKRLGPEASVEITALRGFGYRLDLLNDSDDIASGGVASTPSATDRTRPADPARRSQSAADRRSPQPLDGDRGTAATSARPRTASTVRSGPIERLSGRVHETWVHQISPARVN